ncbi:MAG: hypothetical protein AAF639_32170 [Chloroflexota bacterium]
MTIWQTQTAVDGWFYRGATRDVKKGPLWPISVGFQSDVHAVIRACFSKLCLSALDFNPTFWVALWFEPKASPHMEPTFGRWVGCVCAHDDLGVHLPKVLVTQDYGL